MSPRDDRFLELSHLSMAFPRPGGGRTEVVHDFDLKVRRGEFVCLIGHSGCGKSTVLSAFDNVMLAVEAASPHMARRRRALVASHYLRLVGLEDAAGKKPGALSAGMRQRVGIARAFALQPKVLLLDEPFGMLDSLTRFELQQVLLDLWAQDRKTAFMVTHDVDEALFLADRVAMMTNPPGARIGRILEVPFPRPRDRAAVMDHPRYYELRDQLLEFLNSQEHTPPAAAAG